MGVKQYFIKDDARRPMIAFLTKGDIKYVSFIIFTVCNDDHSGLILFLEIIG